VIGITLSIAAASGAVVAQSALKRPGALPEAPLVIGPAAVTGLASSARHCVSGDASNVHAIGYIAQNTNYTIRFDVEGGELVTAVGRMNLEGLNVSGYGTPEFASVASSAGTMALFVGGNGQAVCYRYQVALRASSSIVPLAPQRLEPAPSAPSALQPAAAVPLAIAGLASSAQHCIGSTFRAHVHDLGRIEAGNRITITFDSTIDPVAGVALIDVAGRRSTYYSDNNSGGSNQPRLSFTAPHGGTMALYVAAAQAFPGCYRYKVEVL
jgi:hypothetical protein